MSFGRRSRTSTEQRGITVPRIDSLLALYRRMRNLDLYELGVAMNHAHHAPEQLNDRMRKHRP